MKIRSILSINCFDLFGSEFLSFIIHKYQNAKQSSCPYTSDYDGDGIMDGVEMGLLARGTDTIDHKDLYGESVTIHFPMEETC